MSKLTKEAIDELILLLDKVKNIVKLLKEWNINIYSDCWKATSFLMNDDAEDILNWDREDFEKINSCESGDIFYIGGNLITGSQHQYEDEWIIAPKELAEVQGKIFSKYLKSLLNSIKLKHFTLKFENKNKLEDNCGWEQFICIDAIVKQSALEKRTAQIKDIEIIKYFEDKEKYLEKELFVNINGKATPIIWVHDLRNKIIFDIK